jgi:hypothetical protein
VEKQEDGNEACGKGMTWLASLEASASGSGHAGDGEERKPKIQACSILESPSMIFSRIGYMEIQKMHHRQVWNVPGKNDSCILLRWWFHPTMPEMLWPMDQRTWMCKGDDIERDDREFREQVV